MQPVPFFYIHLITIVSGIYLPLLTYIVAIEVDLHDQSWQQKCSGFVVSLLAIVAVNLSIIGLQEVAMRLSDPYGEDAVHFPVMSFVSNTLASTRRMVSRPAGQHLDPETENELTLKAYENMALDTPDDPTQCYEESQPGFDTCASDVFHLM